MVLEKNNVIVVSHPQTVWSWNVSGSPFKFLNNTWKQGIVIAHGLWDVQTAAFLSLQHEMDCSTIGSFLLVYCTFQLECAGGLIMASLDFHLLLSVCIQAKLLLSGAGCVWASPGAPPSQCSPLTHVSVCVNHKCLFLPLSGLLPTSHGSLPVSLPGVSAAQVTQGGMTSMPHIHQTARSSRREQTELNLGSYYSEQADCSKLCKNLEGFIIY